MSSIAIIHYKGDANTRNSNRVRNRINKYYAKKKGEAKAENDKKQGSAEKEEFNDNSRGPLIN